MRIRLVDRLRQHVERFAHRCGVPAGRRLRDIEEGIVDLVRRGRLAQRQHPVGLQLLRPARLDLDVPAAEDRVRADRRAAVSADLRTAQREADDDPIALDLGLEHLADVDAGDAHLVPGSDAAGIAELRVIRRLGEQHRHAGEALPHPDHDDEQDDAHQPAADAVGSLEDSHFGVHLPEGCEVTLTVRTGPPGCRPFSFSEMSHR